ISMNLQRVTYVSEHLLPLTPVYTPIKGEGLLSIFLVNFDNGTAVKLIEGYQARKDGWIPFVYSEIETALKQFENEASIFLSGRQQTTEWQRRQPP
ncbi:MAG: hypothetical protein JAZ11_07940, partial [Candidatus Thiodiazotropha lotti]|nr:hypothetical protein [Candidatus Thiodiazotropha lotti]